MGYESRIYIVEKSEKASKNQKPDKCFADIIGMFEQNGKEEILSANLFTESVLINIPYKKSVDNRLKTLFKTIEN